MSVLVRAGGRVAGIVASPVVLTLLILASVSWASGWAPTRLVMGAITAGSAVIVCLAFAYGATEKNPVLHWENESMDDRIRNLVTLLAMTRKSIVLVTGCLHHTLFAHADVIAAIGRLPRGVKVTIYHERPIDPLSAPFLSVLRASCAKVSLIEIKPLRVAHGASIDDLHCKIERLGVADNELNKHVDYYAFDPRRARGVKLSAQSAILPVSVEKVAATG